MAALVVSHPERTLVNVALVRAHLIAGAYFFTAVLLAGLSYALQFTNLYPFPDIPFASPGRVRMVHTNAAAYGFIANAFSAGMLLVIP